MITPDMISSSSEHWLTIMTCIVCENTPDSSPVYKCPMGHFICGNCYAKLRQNGNFLRCKKCLSSDLSKYEISKDFLNKLKIKPGIGRSRRYNQDELQTSLSSHFLFPEEETERVTVEKLFQMNTTQIKQLFQLTARDKLRCKEMFVRTMPGNRQTYVFHNFESGDMGGEKMSYLDIFPIPLTVNKEDVAFEASLSKKPILCPHNRCKKIITISSFAQHFKYDHRDISVFKVERGKELHLYHNSEDLEYGVTSCIAIIHTQEVNEEAMNTFWVMASGSSEEDRLKSYVVYWILTNSIDQFYCTIDVSSYLENISCSTFCGVTRIYDSCNPFTITNELNCLFLTYSSMCNLLTEGTKLGLRVTVY